MFYHCRASFNEECPQHHGHKGDPKVISGTYGAVGEKAQVIILWLRAPNVGNTSYPWRLRVMRIMPSIMHSFWCDLGDMTISKWRPTLLRFEQA